MLQKLYAKDLSDIPVTAKVKDFLRQGNIKEGDKRTWDLVNAMFANEGGDIETWGAGMKYPCTLLCFATL
jgi:hypothetical protein